MYIKKDYKIIFDKAVEAYTWYINNNNKSMWELAHDNMDQYEWHSRESKESFAVYLTLVDILEEINPKVDWSGMIQKQFRKESRED